MTPYERGFNDHMVKSAGGLMGRAYRAMRPAVARWLVDEHPGFFQQALKGPKGDYLRGIGVTEQPSMANANRYLRGIKLKPLTMDGSGVRRGLRENNASMSFDTRDLSYGASARQAGDPRLHMRGGGSGVMGHEVGHDLINHGNGYFDHLIAADEARAATSPNLARAIGAAKDYDDSVGGQRTAGMVPALNEARMSALVGTGAGLYAKKVASRYAANMRRRALRGYDGVLEERRRIDAIPNLWSRHKENKALDASVGGNIGLKAVAQGLPLPTPREFVETARRRVADRMVSGHIDPAVSRTYLKAMSKVPRDTGVPAYSGPRRLQRMGDHVERDAGRTVEDARRRLTEGYASERLSDSIARRVREHAMKSPGLSARLLDADAKLKRHEDNLTRRSLL